MKWQGKREADKFFTTPNGLLLFSYQIDSHVFPSCRHFPRLLLFPGAGGWLSVVPFLFRLIQLMYCDSSLNLCIYFFSCLHFFGLLFVFHRDFDFSDLMLCNQLLNAH